MFLGHVIHQLHHSLQHFSLISVLGQAATRGCQAATRGYQAGGGGVKTASDGQVDAGGVKACDSLKAAVLGHVAGGD